MNARGDKFLCYAHSFVRSMMEKHQTEQTPHYFFVFNQSTNWHAIFDDFNRDDPLGDRFLGYSHDLDELVAVIVGSVRPRLGLIPIVHILMPNISPFAITEPLSFPEMGPFRVTGELDESGLPFVYLCMPLVRTIKISATPACSDLTTLGVAPIGWGPSACCGPLAYKTDRTCVL